MQIEKHLFRVAERSLRNPFCRIYCTILCGFCLLVGIFFFSIFCYAGSTLMEGKHYLKECINQIGKQNVDIFNQQAYPIWGFYFKSFSELQHQQTSQNEKVKDQNQQTNTKTLDKDAVKKIYECQYCNVYLQKWFHSQISPSVEFSTSRSVLSLDLAQRQQLNVRNLTFLIKYPLISAKLIDPSTILINEILDIHIKTAAKWLEFKLNDQIIIYQLANSHVTLLDRLYQLGKAIIFYIFISASTSLYIYGTIISAPALIIIAINITRIARQENMTNIYRLFPWLGLHVIARQTSTNVLVNQTSHVICAALLYYFLTVYFIFYSVILKATQLIFDNLHEIGIQQIFCIFIAFIEFASIVFMRTRPFIHFYPKIHSLLIMVFLLYSSCVEYGYKRALLLSITMFSISLFAWMILQLEIPAQETWDRNQCFTPTVDRPRCGMFPVFNMNWIYNSPDDWTRFIPLHGRQHFNNEQLAFVDKRYDLLDEVPRQQP